MYCIWDTAQNSLVSLVGRLDKWVTWADGDMTSPGEVGMVHGNEIIANYVDNKPRPPKYHAVTSSDHTYDPATQTVTKNYTVERVSSPDAEDVKEEARDRLMLPMGNLADIFDIFMDWMELKEKKDSGGTLTQAEIARVQELKSLWQHKEAVKAAAKTLIQMNPIPDDYDDDSRWP